MGNKSIVVRLRRLYEMRVFNPFRGDGLRAKAIRGSGWTLAGFGSQQVLRLGSNLILTRLLFPEAFGLMALASVFMTGLEMFSDIGIRPSIIQNKRGNDVEFLNTAWTMGVIRGFVLWSIICILSYPLSRLYEQPILFPMLCTIGSMAAIRGFQTTGYATSNKHLRLGRLTMVELSTMLLGILTMIVWAWIDPSVWSLVGGGLVSSLSSVLLGHWVLNTHRHRFRLEREAYRELVGFGKWIILSSAITFFAQSGDRALLPKVLNIQDLAFYSIAMILAQMPARVFGQLATRVLFPVYAQVVKNNDVDRINNVSRRFSLMSWPLYAIPVTTIFFAQWLISVMYDPRYAASGGALSMLAISSYMRMMRSSQEGLLLAIGNSKAHMLTNLTRLVSWVPFAILLAGQWGLEGFCAGIAIADALTLLAQRYFTHRSIPKLSSRVDTVLLLIILAAVALKSAFVWYSLLS